MPASPLTAVFQDADVKAALVESLKKAIARDPKAPYVIQLTNVIDGYLQTISRRLTMLRQSADPNFDLYFMEVSSSLEAAKDAKNHVARVRWTIGKNDDIDWTALADELVSEKVFTDLVKLATDEKWTVFAGVRRARAAAAQPQPNRDARLDSDLMSYLVAGCMATNNGVPLCQGQRPADADYNDLIARGIATVRGSQDPGSGSARIALAKRLVSDNVFDELVNLATRETWTVSTRQSAGAAVAMQPQPVRDARLEIELAKYLEAGCMKLAHVPEICQGTPAISGYNEIIARGIANYHEDKVRNLEKLKPYVFELSPAQGAVNIARSEIRENRLNIYGVLKFLIGIGVSVNYQRQRDIFRQFLQQDVFQAGQGKGSQDEFGWDYGPMPGEDRVASGAYTTYGVLAMPSFRRSISFTTKADWLLKPANGGKSWDVANRPNATATAYSSPSYTVYLPNRYDFWVDALYYPRVPVGEEASVILRGKGFTAETMVLINNIPLTPRWRLIDPASSDVSYAAPNGPTPPSVENGGGDRKTYGAYELMSSDTIAMRFRVPNFEGVPQITLISPHRSIQVNDLKLPVNVTTHPGTIRLAQIQENYESGLSLDNIMFGPAADWRTLASQDFLRVDDIGRRVDIRLHMKHVPLDMSGVEVFDGARWIPAPDAQANQDLSTLVLERAPLHDGDLLFKLVELDPDGWKTGMVLLEGRIAVPLRPRIEKLFPAGGSAAGGEEIEITGYNFSHVDKVFFGAVEGTILSRRDRALRVRVPKGTADTKAKVRVVSDVPRDGKELASTQDNQLYVYAAAAAPKPARMGGLKFGDLGTEAQAPKIDAIIDVDVPSDAGTLSVQANDGKKWSQLTLAVLPDKKLSLSGITTVRGKIELRLLAKKGNAAPALLDEQTFDVPYVPQLDSAPPPATPGESLVLKGKNLQLVEVVWIGKAKATILSQVYDQITVTVPDRESVQPDSSGRARVVVNAGPRSSGETVMFTFRP